MSESTGIDSVAECRVPPPPHAPPERGTSVGSLAVPVAVELWTGGLLLVGMLVLGGLVAHESRPTIFDQMVQGRVPHLPHAVWTGVVHLGSPLVLVPVVLLCAIWALRQGVRLAAVCALSPIVAALLAQILKHVFDRLDTGVASYPSGTVATVAAVAAVAVIAVDRRWKPAVAVIGGLLVVAMCLTVVALRWHYPTDAGGGAALGVGVAMVADGLSALRPRTVGSEPSAVSAGPSAHR